MADAPPPGPSQRSDDEERAARATALLDEAQHAALEHGRAVVAEARAVRRRMLEDADERRRELIVELEQLRAAIDRTIAALQVPAEDVPPRPRTDESPPDSSADTDPGRAAALFDQLRAEPSPPPEPRARKPAQPPAPVVPDDGPAAAHEPDGPPLDEPAPDAAPVEPAPEVAPDAAPEPPVDPAKGRRDTLLGPLLPDVVRSSKRLLQDEQNSLLDAVRRARGKHEAARLLPEPVRQRETWTALLGPSIDAAYLGGRAASGKTGRVSRAPERVVVELAAALVNPLRERIIATIDTVIAEGPYESPIELQRALGAAIGARFREWRTRDLEEGIVDVLCAAYARGAYEAAGPAATLRWLADEPGRCPDCDDNTLEQTLKGKAFPTGQTHPPAHPGCRCLALPTGP
jgi:hypothetical protein